MQTVTGTVVVPPYKLVHYQQMRISVTRGPDVGLYLDVGGREIRVGTAVENDMVLNDDTVSRRHCSLEPTEHGLRVRDEASTNGVVFAGSRVYDAVLVPNPVVLQIGDTELTITPLEPKVTRQQLEIEGFAGLIGKSARMRELFADLARVAASDVSVLIEGETGTGKELVAEAIHERSARARGPFIVFDCGAVAPNLAESELFGHVRGAFTGAVDGRTGVFQQANGGTIFLDELGELPKELQPKLLRVLEKREVRRLGSSQPQPIDVRVVAATNRNLSVEVQRGRFREDLYFRLAGAHVLVPPLRSRIEDLRLLVEHFGASLGRAADVSALPAHVWQLLESHRWPGNVRELKNAVQRLILMPAHQFPAWASSPPKETSPFLTGSALLPLKDARLGVNDAFERDYLRVALAHSAQNVTRAASAAQVSRQMFYKLMSKHGLPE